MAGKCAAVIPRAALDQLVAVADDLEGVRVAEGLSLRDVGRMLGMKFSNVYGLRARARTSTVVPLLEKYAQFLGYSLRVVVVEDRPEWTPPPWRERMPRCDDPRDAHAMTEAWRLQQRLHTLRRQGGYGCDEVAEALGIGTLALWRLENNPAAIDAAAMNVMLLARFFGYTLRLNLHRRGVTDMGWWITDDGTTVPDGNPDTGDDEPHDHDD